VLVIKGASKGRKRAHVYVVSGEEPAREWLIGFLSAGGYRVHAFEDARAFERAWQPLLPQCVLCDLDVPPGEGLQVLRRLRERHQDVPVIGLAAGAGVRAVADAMRLGAVNVLEKPVSERVLLKALEEVFEAEHAERGHLPERRRAQRLLAGLSPREREVLDLVAEGLSSKQIALRLGLSKRTIDIHRGKLLRKLEAGSVVDLVKIHAQRRGGQGFL
jgi:FixJ family two-component response regulator